MAVGCPEVVVRRHRAVLEVDEAVLDQVPEAAAEVGEPQSQPVAHQRLLDAVNARGPVLLSHTKLDGRFVLRVAIGNIRTDREHLETAWRLLREEADRL